ncbi:hypothetical protein [Brevibacillus migulae]|uniref:hypothetical protein n=1 Tax=Brevibacillus migulae TaxID=1644114 RepID=UPI00106E68EF|nr:hypothetical protein [Brevibacillus migulae]
MWLKLMLTSLLLIMPVTCAYAERVDIGSIQVDTSPTQHERDLIERSTLIVYGWADSAEQQTYPTGKRVPSGALVNFVQTLHVKRAFKGASPKLIQLLSTGIEPLPDPKDPLNNRYPGPLAEGDYIIFLKKVSGTNLYTTVGIWQGVYPFLDGKSVALRGSGYPSLEQLSLDQFGKKLETYMKRP